MNMSLNLKCKTRKACPPAHETPQHPFSLPCVCLAQLVATGRRLSIPTPHNLFPSDTSPSHPGPSHSLPPKPKTSVPGAARQAGGAPGGSGCGAETARGEAAEAVEVALMGAAVTAAGNVELFTMTRGQARARAQVLLRGAVVGAVRCALHACTCAWVGLHGVRVPVGG